jgi:hypothetical protein
VLQSVIEGKNWSSETFIEKLAEFANENGIEDEIIDFMMTADIERISEDTESRY